MQYHILYKSLLEYKNDKYENYWILNHSNPPKKWRIFLKHGRFISDYIHDNKAPRFCAWYFVSPITNKKYSLYNDISYVYDLLNDVGYTFHDFKYDSNHCDNSEIYLVKLSLFECFSFCRSLQ